MKIGIVGAFARTRSLAPFDDPDWLIWSLSPKNKGLVPRHDAWFELHWEGQARAFGGGYWDWLKTLPLVYMPRQHAEIPGSQAYPLEDMRTEFGPYFLTSTIADMMALAISRRPEAIGLWGLGQCPEFQHQRPSILHFVQTARDRGIEVTEPSGLLDPPLPYGFEKDNPYV